MVASDIRVLWDLDNDGDFSEPEEDITGYFVEGEAQTGRDWPSQLTGKAGPGRLKLTLRNDDGRFSYFNTASPLNAGGFSLKTGRKIQVRTTTAPDPNPDLLVRDRFNRPNGEIGAAETGQAWTNATTARLAVEDGRAVAGVAEGERTNIAVVDAGADDYYAQVTCSEIGENCNDTTTTSGVQEYDVVGLVYRYQDASNYSVFRVGRVDAAPSQFAYVEMVDVVAGVETLVAGGASSGLATLVPHDNVVLGVHVDSTTATGYINGCPALTGTAVQGDETEVGLFAEWGVGNKRPSFENFHVWADVTAPTAGILWTGYVSDIVATSRLGPDNTVTVTAEGPLSRLAKTNIRPESIHGINSDVSAFANTGNWTGQMVGEALAKAGLLFPPGQLDRGAEGSGGYGFDEIAALEFARTAEALEFGFLYESPEGWINFDDRNARLSSYSLATFSDEEGVGLGYTTIEPKDWKREVVNSVTAGVAARAPRIVGSATLTSGTGAVSGTIPNDVKDGDLVLLIIASTSGNAEEPWQTPFFWVKNHDSGPSGSRRMAIYSRIDSGDGAGQTFTFMANNSGATGTWVSALFLIYNWYRDHQGIQIGDFVSTPSGEGAGSTPAPISPSWGFGAPTLFVAARIGTGFNAPGAITNPTYPLGYFAGNHHFENGADDAFDVGLQVAVRADVTDYEAPGPFTGFVNLFNVESVVIAVRGLDGYPVGAVPRERDVKGGLKVRRDDRASQAEHNIVRTHDGPTLFRHEGEANDYTRRIIERFSDDRPIIKIGFVASTSAEHREQAIIRRLSDRITLGAENTTGLGINGDFHIENIAHRWSAGGTRWETTWELSPADDVMRVDTAGSTLDHGRNEVVVNMNVATTTGPLWINSVDRPSHFPFVAVIDAGEPNEEHVRVLSVTGSSSPQAFVVERGVDGTTAALHDAGATVSLADPLIAQ